tara:strand:+ start:277 stop:540 length:264 start_codon:yes stop_codon:yes gene_type:complete
MGQENTPKIRQMPSSLDWILAYSPIPWFGDKSAERCATYLTDFYGEDACLGPMPEFLREEDIARKYFGMRVFGYTIISGIIKGIEML